MHEKSFADFAFEVIWYVSIVIVGTIIVGLVKKFGRALIAPWKTETA